jgi:3-deoxy-D-manno-octulosonic-acid transferase
VVGELGNWIEFEAQRMVIIVSSTTPSNQSTTKPQRARIKQRGNQQKLLLPPRGRDRAVGVRALLRSESSDKKVIRRTCRS